MMFVRKLKEKENERRQEKKTEQTDLTALEMK